MTRGLATVAEMTPTLRGAATLAPGKPNFGVFVRLKTSPRNCKLDFSVKRVVFCMDKSRFRWLGPRSMFLPQFPKPVPSKSAGARRKAEGLKYAFNRLS